MKWLDSMAAADEGESSRCVVKCGGDGNARGFTAFETADSTLLG